MKKNIILILCFILFACGETDDGLSENEAWGISSSEQQEDGVKKAKIAVDIIEKKKNNLQIDYGVFKKGGNRTFKVAVVISGRYFEFFDAFRSILKGLMTVGWMKDADLSSCKNTSDLIEFVNENNISDYVSFPEELFFDLGWGRNTASMRSVLISNSDKEKIDLIIALGGIAGGIFAKLDEYSIPVLVDAVTDPIAAGIIPGFEDSGKDFLTCRCDPEQFKRQIRLFYDVVKFKKLGIIYGDNESGRVYGAVGDVEAVAEEKGFEIVRNNNVIEDPPENQLELCISKFKDALEEISPKVDALYIGASAGVTEGDVGEIVKIINKHKIPSFALEGSIRVKAGILFGISMSGQVRAGVYNAKKIVAIFNGETPRNLLQLFENVPSVAINIRTAKIIDYDIPIDIIAGSDEVYVDNQENISNARDK